MQKPFRAVLVLQDAPKREVTLLAKSDFDALTQAKQVFGTDSHFELWEGERRALTYRPGGPSQPKIAKPS